MCLDAWFRHWKTAKEVRMNLLIHHWLMRGHFVNWNIKPSCQWWQDSSKNQPRTTSAFSDFARLSIIRSGWPFLVLLNHEGNWLHQWIICELIKYGKINPCFAEKIKLRQRGFAILLTFANALMYKVFWVQSLLDEQFYCPWLEELIRIYL